MVLKSPASRATPILIGGIGLCGLQLYHLLNAKPGANYGILIGSLVGCAIGTIIGIVLAIRAPVRIPESKALREAERQQASANKQRGAKKAYIVCVVAWIVAAGTMIPLSMVNSEQVAIIFAIFFGIAFFVGLAALIIGKALGDASKR